MRVNCTHNIQYRMDVNGFMFMWVEEYNKHLFLIIDCFGAEENESLKRERRVKNEVE